MKYFTREDMQEKDKFNLEECRERGLKLYQCPPVQFLLVSLATLALVFIIASKVVLDVVSVTLILLGFGLILTFAGWFIAKKYKARFN